MHAYIMNSYIYTHINIALIFNLLNFEFNSENGFSIKRIKGKKKNNIVRLTDVKRKE